MSIMIASRNRESDQVPSLQKELLPTTMDCATEETLRAYLDGTAGSDVSALEEHLETCLKCKEVLREIEREPDSMAGLLQGESLQALLEQPADLTVGSKGSPGTQRESKTSLPKVLGAYRLIESLGRGGMGTVFLAVHQSLHKQVAVKLLPSGLLANPEALARFERETLAAGQLDHPSIVRATDAGEFQGYRYLAMEYIRGMDLSHLAKANGPLKIADACEMIRQAALGLSHAHQQGMVHRDIKPSNLMLDESGNVKILDFGLVQCDRWDSPQQELTTVGQLMGTLDYMAPEQAERSGGVDHRADLYALGATLFRLLSGRAPLVATPSQSPLEKLRLLIHHQPPSLALFRPDAPTELVELVDRLLATSPVDRLPSAAHVAQALVPFTNGCDLKTLLANVKTKSDSTSRSAPQLKAAPAFPSKAKDVPNALSHSKRSNWKSRIGWWIALGLLPWFLFAGYLIVLETSMGQLVIESEVADIHVKILKDGKEAKGLTLRPGANTSRMMVDRYEIVLETPSDDVSIENGVFTLRRGETVVARVRTIENTTINQAVAKPTPKSDEPRYEDKTYSEWLETLRREKSPEMIRKSTIALGTLKPYVKSGDEIEDAIRKFAFPLLSYDPLVIESLIEGPNQLERLKEEFERGDERARIAFLSFGKNLNVEVFDRRPFLEWIVANSNLSRLNPMPRLQLSANTIECALDQLWHCVRNDGGKVELLNDVKSKNWLVRFYRFYLMELGVDVPNVLLATIQNRIADELCEEPDWKHDACILHFIEKYGIGEDVETRKRIASELGKRLVHYSQKLDVKSDTDFRLHGYGPLPHYWIKQEQNSDSYPTLCILRLLWLFDRNERPSDDIQKIYDATKEKQSDFLKKLSKLKNWEVIQIKWADLKSNLPVSSSDLAAHLCHVISGALLNKDVEFLPGQHWKPFELADLEVDNNELHAFEELDTRKQGFVPIGRAFGFLDRNKDGVVSVNELKLKPDVDDAHLDGISDPVNYGWYDLAFDLVKKNDKDKDRCLDETELPGPSGAFDKFEQTGDRRITIFEIYKWYEANRK